MYVRRRLRGRISDTRREEEEEEEDEVKVGSFCRDIWAAVVAATRDSIRPANLITSGRQKFRG